VRERIAPAQVVPGYEVSGWQGFGAPKNTPPEIIERLNRQINACLADPKIKARIADLGTTAFPASPTELGKLMVEETEKWAKVICRHQAGMSRGGRLGSSRATNLSERYGGTCFDSGHRRAESRYDIMRAMTRNHFKEILNRVLSWPIRRRSRGLSARSNSGARTMTSAKRNGRSSRRARRGAIWRLIKKSNRCSVAIGGHEAPI
jgi:Tripartite tricarboxylate transporter family receptor